MKSKVLFSEKQYFHQFLVIGLLVFVHLFFMYGFVQQIIFRHPFGTKSAPDIVLILLMIGGFLLTYFTLKASLTTRISTDGVTYQFYPFQRQPRCIPWHDIKTCYVRKYNPLKEYGGWGYRNYPKNSAVNVSGNVGIQLVLRNQEYILVGTKKGAQAQQVIDSIQTFSV